MKKDGCIALLDAIFNPCRTLHYWVLDAHSTLNTHRFVHINRHIAHTEKLWECNALKVLMLHESEPCGAGWNVGVIAGKFPHVNHTRHSHVHESSFSRRDLYRPRFSVRTKIIKKLQVHVVLDRAFRSGSSEYVKHRCKCDFASNHCAKIKLMLCEHFEKQ